MCDGISTLILHDRIPITDEVDGDVRLNLIEHAIAEYIDRVNEQARVVRWLHEI